MKRIRALCERFAGRRGAIALAGVAVALGLPSLFVGLQADDYFIREIVTGHSPVPELSQSRWLPYVYSTGDPQRNHILMSYGIMPWWTVPQWKAALSRPLTALTFIADYALWPTSPALMHVQNVLWYGLAVWGAAVLYRRLLGVAWPAALAGLLFAVDDAHGIPAAWLANRNAVLAVCFGAWALVAHDRWRRDGWKPGALVGPALLLLGLLAKEEAVSLAGYVLAYAVFIEARRPTDDHAPATSWWSRAGSFAPYGVVLGAWYVVYRALGYGVAHSGVYVDPGADPLRFAAAVVTRAPMLLLGQFGAPPSDLGAGLSASMVQALWVWAVVFLLLLAVGVWPLLRRSAAARFFAAGALTAVVPMCAVFSSDRLLMYTGLGASGLIACFVAGMAERPAWAGATAAGRGLRRALAAVLVALHLVLAPVLFVVQSFSIPLVVRQLEREFLSLPKEPAFASQNAIYVNSTCNICEVASRLVRQARDLPTPARSLYLNAAGSPATLERLDKRTIVVRPTYGYLTPKGTQPGGDGTPPLFSVIYLGQLMDHLTRPSDEPMTPGERVSLDWADVEVIDLTEDGRPAAVMFTFAKPLEDTSYRWFSRGADGYAAFPLPAVGETVDVPAPFGK